MTMKHFDTDFFAEIINGMTKTCEGLEVQQLLSAATKIYREFKFQCGLT